MGKINYFKYVYECLSHIITILITFGCHNFTSIKSHNRMKIEKIIKCNLVLRKVARNLT